MSADVVTSASAIVGGFFGGLLLGYALKKVVKAVAIIAGLFIAGLAYLQYQQIAAFDWNRIEVMASLSFKQSGCSCSWFHERMIDEQKCFSIEAN